MGDNCRKRTACRRRLTGSRRDVRDTMDRGGRYVYSSFMSPRRTKAGAPDPWRAPDPALAVALEELEYYRRERDHASRAYQAAETFLLLAAAGATLTAGLGAAKWLTASFAASALVLASILRVFDWHGNWLDFANASLELRMAINQHRLIPDDQRCNEESQRRLIGQLDEIAASQGSQWISRRRQVVRDLDQ
jgi:hypothetical protein